MKLKSFDPVVVPLPSDAVDDQAVSSRMNEIVAQIPCYADVTDDVAAPDDKVKVRLTMWENDVPVKGLDGVELTISLSDGFFPQGLTSGIVGMHPGEERHLEWEGAGMGSEDEDDRSSRFAADVQVVSVRKRVRPPMTDEWVARHIPRCTTLEEFRLDVRTQLEQKARASHESMKRERCAIALAQRLEGDPAEEDVERALTGVRDNFAKALAREGKSRAQKAAELGVEEEGLEGVFRMQAVLVAKQGAAARIMADHLGVEVTDADRERVLRENFSGGKEARMLVESEAGRAKIDEVARCEKALDYVVEHCVVVDEPAEGVGGGTAHEASYPNPFSRG